MQALKDMLRESEDWLVERVLGYAQEHGYTRYTSPRIADLRLSVAGLTGALCNALDASSGLPEPCVDDRFSEDPASEFAVTEARLHRRRGVSLALFLGLFTYYRRAYLDLVTLADLSPADRGPALRLVQRFFERVAIAVAVDWCGQDQDLRMAELETANRDLINEKNRYFTLFEALDQPVFVLDAGDRIATCNTAAAEWLMLSSLPGSAGHGSDASVSGGGLVASGMIGRPVREVIPSFADEIEAFGPGGQPRTSFEKSVKRQGRKAWYKVSLARMQDFSREFLGMLVVLEDVTARRSAEEILQLDHVRLEELVRQNLRELEAANERLRREVRERELAEEAMRQGAQFYRAVVEDQTELICRFTPDGVLTFVNLAYSRYYHRDREDLMGRSFAELLPEDERRQVLERISAITRENPVLEVEHRVLAPDGEERWHRWINRGIFDQEGKLLEYQGVGSDITERKRAERALQELNETLERKVEARARDATERAEKIGRINAALQEEISRRREAETVLRKRLAMEEILSEASSRFINLLPEGLDQGIEEALGVLGGLLGVDRSYVFRIEGAAMSNTHEWCAAGVEPQKGSLQDTPWEMFPWWMSRMWGFQNVIIPDVAALPPEAGAEKKVLLEQSVRSLVAVPMVRAGHLIGFLGFDAVRARREWKDEDIGLLETFSRILVGAIESRRMEGALRTSEQRYRELVENLAEGILIVDAADRIVFVNESLGRMLGRTAMEMVGSTIYSLVDESWREALRAKLDMRRQGISSRYEIEMRHSKGDTVYALVSGVPIFDDQGGYAGSRALVSDITREKYMQAQLLQAQKLESIGQLAAGIAHEINTPTQYVANNTEFLARAFGDMLGLCDRCAGLAEQARRGQACGLSAAGIEAEMERLDVAFLKEEIPRAIAESREGLERIAAIVRSVKHFAHPVGEAKRHEDLNEGIRSAVTVSTNEWKYVSEMVLDLDEDLPSVPCVLGEINQVVLNLITNAAHAIAQVLGEGSARKGRITIGTRRDGDWVELRVSDTGSGIPAGIRSRVFDPFFTTKPVGQGTGQGLAISHTIVVEKHGGSIRFETEEGRGATFIVRLPLVEDATP
ncbi:MAG: PAS domain S-box protein [Thermodesulfobacteriota bacterium]